MKKWWWSLFLICSLLGADSKKEACAQEIQAIDAQVQKLEVLKKKHIDLARKYQAEGDRWKYSTGRIDEAHAAWAKADDERAKAIEYEMQIDLLLEKKQRIYQYYPDLRHD
jgi:hypothetical protein